MTVLAVPTDRPSSYLTLLILRQLQQYYLPEPEDDISKKLPKEILFRIFSFLDVVSLCRCAQVSDPAARNSISVAGTLILIHYERTRCR